MANFQNSLLKKKGGTFGLVWLAAHHPSKLSKIEIIQLDLTKKCKELRNLAIGNTPQISLMLSAHLMYGLVVILNKKSIYLYEELVRFKAEISQIHVKEKDKRPAHKKVKSVDAQTITTKEILPDLLQLRTLDDYVEDLIANPLERAREITLTETDEGLYTSNLIPVDYDFQMDSFDADPQLLFLPDVANRIERRSIANVATELNEMSDLGPPADTIMDMFEMDYIEKTVVRKPSEVSRAAREPFAVLDSNKQLKRAEEMQARRSEDTSNLTEIEAMMRESENIEPGRARLASIAPITEESIAERGKQIQDIADTMLYSGDDMLISGIEPASTTVMPEQQDAAPSTPPQPAPTSPQQAQPPADEIRTISPEIQEFQDKLTKRVQKQISRKTAKKRGILIDEVKEIPLKELKRQIGRGRGEEENEYGVAKVPRIDELDARFRESTDTYLQTKFEYLHVNLFNQPSGSMARRTRVFTQSELKSFVRCDLVMKLKSLKTNKQPDDTQFYLTQGRARQLISEPTSIMSDTNQVTTEDVSATEKQREQQSTEQGKRISFMEVGAPAAAESGIVSRARRTQTRSSILKPTATEIQPEVQQPVDNYIPLPDTGMSFYDQTMMPSELGLGPELASMTDTSVPIAMEPATTVHQPETLSKDQYQQMILDRLESVNEFTLQDMIKENPRKDVACRLFISVLNLAAKKKIIPTQMAMYGPISITASFQTFSEI